MAVMLLFHPKFYEDRTVLECVILKKGFIPFKKVYLPSLLREHFVYAKKTSVLIVYFEL